MEKTYDMIVSLGGNCYVAVQLRHRGMRPYSLPLDWTYIKGAEYVAKLPELIRTKFADFCIYENMKDIGEPGMEAGKPTYKFEELGMQLTQPTTRCRILPHERQGVS